MRILLHIFSIFVGVFALSAQTADVIREMICKNPNFAEPIISPYDESSIGRFSSPPKGYKPFYFSATIRHGSRYELQDSTYIRPTEVYNRAAELGILTPLGEEVRQLLIQATAKQIGQLGELSPLGQKQMRDLGRRAYNNFKSIFESGNTEGRSSDMTRCILSMNAFVDGLKENNRNLSVEIYARDSDVYILRPMSKVPPVPAILKELWEREGRRGGAWREKIVEWSSKQDVSTMLSKVVTRPELLTKSCGAHSDFLFAYNTHHLLLYAQNFEAGDSEILTRLFTPEEQYIFYLYESVKWLWWSGGWGNPMIESYSAYVRPLVEDVLNKAQDAIDGKNPNVADLRFTHDTYLLPLLTVFGYENCSIQYSDNWEHASISAPLSEIMPMAANLQLILYRNKRGDVLVRSLLNERDVTLPIECDTTPFYPLKELCSIAERNIKRLEQTRDKFLLEYQR